VRRGMTARELVIVGIFGAAGAALEISVGTFLHTFPVLPFKGMFLASLLAALFVAVRIVTGRRGAPFLVAAVIAALKLLSPGAGFMTVVLAILMEGVTAGLVLAVGTMRGPLVPILAGMSTALYTVAHKFLVNGLLLGSEIYGIYLGFLEDASVLLGLSPSDALWLLVPVLVLHLIAGGAAGLLGWRLGRRLLRITHRENP